MKAILNDTIFRGYDIRGKVPSEMNIPGVYKLARAYATFLIRRRIYQCVAVADNRIHSEKIKKAFIKGLIDSGVNVIDHGLGVVYFMYFSQYFNQSIGGVSISASHNPKEYNGFKLGIGFSNTMVTHEIQELKNLVKKGKFVKANKKGKLVKKPIFNDYKKDLFKRMPDKKLGFKVFIDGGNCTPAKFLPNILREAGCEVIAKNTKLDGRFPLGTPDPTESEYLERVSQGVKKYNCDIGFCYDPDGDRIGVVDEKGNMIWNDTLVSIFSMDLLEFEPGSTIVFNTLCSKQTDDVIRKHGGKPLIWITGHSFIKAKLKEERGLFAGELSGHFFFMDNFYGHDDGAYTTLRLLNYLKRKKKTLGQVVKTLPQYVSSPEIKLGLPDKIKFKFVNEVIGGELKKLYPKADYIEIDGVRMDTKETMAIVRASQNGPYITIKYEGRTQAQYDKLKEQLREILKSHKEIDWNYGVNTDAFD